MLLKPRKCLTSKLTSWLHTSLFHKKDSMTICQIYYFWILVVLRYVFT